MIKVITSLKDCCDNIDSYLNSKEVKLAIIEHEITEVTFGFDSEIKTEYCIMHNIPYYFPKRRGGTIVCSRGNISIGIVYPNSVYKEFIGNHLAKDFTAFLKDKGIDSNYVNNDIMIGNNKVGSISERNIAPNYQNTFSTAQFSINIDKDVIDAVCTKQKIKIPKALSDYNITTEEVKNWLYSWFSNYFGDELV